MSETECIGCSEPPIIVIEGEATSLVGESMLATCVGVVTFPAHVRVAFCRACIERIAADALRRISEPPPPPKGPPS